MQSEYVQQLRSVPAQRRIPFADPVQEVEVLWLRKLLCFSNACRKLLPRHYVFNSCEGIGAVLLGFEQSLPDLPIKPELVVDGLAVNLELLLVLVLCSIEQLADDPVVQFDHFVGDSGRPFDGQRDQRRIPAICFKLHQVSRGHLAAFTRDLQEPVLVNLPLYASRQVESPPRLQPLNMLQRVPGVRPEW